MGFNDLSDSLRVVNIQDRKGDASNSLSDAISIAVDRCLLSDVNVGVFLSGGIDSSLVAYFASEKAKLNSYCVGFKNKGYDESVHASRVADKIGIDHQTYFLSDDEIESIVLANGEIFGEPFSDPSFIPLVALSRFASKQITVALTGDGGDELFYGYNRHVHGQLASKLNGHLAAKLMLNVAKRFPSFVAKVGSAFGYNAVLDKLSKLDTIVSSDRDQLYWSFLKGDAELASPNLRVNNEGSLVEYIRAMDIEYYQQSGTLVKSDRCSMYSSIELRAPLLEESVHQYVKSHSTPQSEISRQGGKTSLRNLAYSCIGKDLLDRPKAGFTPPLVDWMNGPLNEWANKGLCRLGQAKLFPSAPLSVDKNQTPYSYYLQVWRYAILGHWLAKEIL